MGFKVNYHPEVIALLAILITSINVNANANANIPKHDAIGDIIEQTKYTVPAPTPILPKLKSINREEVLCLAEAVYFESKNQSLQGQRAVAHVIINRTKSSKFPETICRVINQKYKSICQFSYKCDGAPDIPKNKKDYGVAMNIAKDALDGNRDVTKGALYFHNHTVKPAWAKTSKLTVVIGDHKFYKG